MRTDSLTIDSALCGTLFAKALATILESAAAAHFRRKEECSDTRRSKVCARLWFATVVACNGVFALALLVSYIKFVHEESEQRELSTGTQFIACFLMPVCLLADLITDAVMLLALPLPLSSLSTKKKQVTEEEKHPETLPGPAPLAITDIVAEIEPPPPALPIALAPPLAMPIASAPPLPVAMAAMVLGPKSAMQLDPSAVMDEHEFEEHWARWPVVLDEEREVSYAWTLAELQAAIAAAGFVCMAGIERNGQMRCYALGVCATSGVQCMISIRRGTLQQQSTQQFSLMYKSMNADCAHGFAACINFM
jgi:hypothetical protein